MEEDVPPARTRDAVRTKARLLDAARDEFAEYGIAGARVERIAAAAGCNKAMIYRYFDDKDALFDAAFAAHVTAHLDRVNFDATDLPAYAGRLFDILEDDAAAILVFVVSIANAWATLNPEFSATSAPDRSARRRAVTEAVARLIAPD